MENTLRIKPHKINGLMDLNQTECDKTNTLFVLLLPLNDLCQLADHYCHWLLELSFSRSTESTAGYIFSVGSFTSPGIDTR